MLEHIDVIREALVTARRVCLISAKTILNTDSEVDRLRGEAIKIDAALAALDAWEKGEWQPLLAPLVHGKCYCGCDACKYCEQLLEPETKERGTE